MTDPRFFKNSGVRSLTELAEAVGGTLRGESREIRDVAAIEDAGAHELAYLEASKYAEIAQATKASALITTEALAEHAPDTCAVLICDAPYRAFVEIARLFYPDAARGLPLAGDLQDGHDIHPTAKLGENVRIGHGALIGPDAEIGDNTHIGAYAVIGHGVAIGRDCVIGPHSLIGYALIGDRVIMSGGAHIGQDGYGFVPGETHLKIPQLGRVIIQADVEIQAGCAIDRGAIGDTIIGEGTRLDNLVHIAHNIKIGRHCFITAQVGMAGSSTVGDYTMMGGKAGIADHLTIGKHATIAGLAAVVKDVADGETVAGNPARPIREMQRDMLFVNRLRKQADKK